MSTQTRWAAILDGDVDMVRKTRAAAEAGCAITLHAGTGSRMDTGGCMWRESSGARGRASGSRYLTARRSSNHEPDTRVVMTRHLHHITLDTGHTRRSPRSEVSDGVLPAVGQLLASALERDVPIIGAPAYSLRAAAEGDALLATVSHRDDGPVATFGVARNEAASPRLWATMPSRVEPAIGTRELDRPPLAPWLAVRLYPALALHADAADWLGDLERCIAWAWIEGHHLSRAAELGRRGGSVTSAAKRAAARANGAKGGRPKKR